MDSPTKANQDGYEYEFVWDDYLEDTNSKATPPTAFVHVEHSLVSNLKIGMKLEVVNPEEEETCYWVASVVMICGPLLSLRYLGYGDERTADFWCDLKAGEFHPIGWCSKNRKRLHPPKGVRDRHANFMSLIVPSLEVDTIPVSILEDPESGITPIDQIKPDMYVEVTDELNYENVWPAKIVQNVGGRLLLRHANIVENEEHDFWLFYLSERIHPLGWGKINRSVYKPPQGVDFNMSVTERIDLLDLCFKEESEYPFPGHILEPQISFTEHKFKENMKLEILNPLTLLDIHAATVTKIINSRYFMVEVDSYSTDENRVSYPNVCCHSASMIIFPCNWAKENGLSVVPPEGYGASESGDLDWGQYLAFCKQMPAPKDLFRKPPSLPLKFEVLMKLEAVNPFSSDEIFASTIEKVVYPLLWIRNDSAPTNLPSHAVAVNSFDILPVGWCASNAYPLKTPVITKARNPQSSADKNGVSSSNEKAPESVVQKVSGGKSWCPKIYFNHCCFTGPYLSKSRLAELPQAIGPGPLHLVMKDVLTRLINIAYKSSRVLKELQICGKPDPKMLQQTIKAKYKGKSYRATVESIRNSEQVEDFCRKICIKLDCCPHLFGPNHVGQDCPDNCYTLTKTKFGNGFVKRQKKTSVDESGEVKRGPGRKKKRKHWRLIHAENNQEAEKQSAKETQPASTTPKESKSPKTSDSEDEVPKKRAKELSDSESKVVTRGAKLPNIGRDPSSKEPETESTPVADSSGEQEEQRLSPKTSILPVIRKKGRPVGSTKKAIAATVVSKRLAQQRDREEIQRVQRNCKLLQEAEQIGLSSNPIQWSVEDVVKYIRNTNCAPLAHLLREQEIDGQALLMLTLYSVQEFLHLKPDPAKVFCSLVEKIKCEFFMRFT